ncbi:C2H2 finger domain transcription factor crzA [Erysiphe neolycopersici]|uniref:C2H2 finger domain transcription factor crzA n=1 Tax=Erysiphe neolycopersici TaxID=212602 RepID=A0A420HUV6_9PEZI|nr:C2H2 finger domain transcription factor crzA [Erysiphe neolycopersici]
MESRYSPIWSNGYQESSNDRSHAWTQQDNANPNEMIPSLRNSFLNSNQTGINSNGTPYQNCSISFIDNRISSDYKSHSDLNQQFHKQEKCLQFTQRAEKQQNIREDLLLPNLQNNSQINISSTSLSRNSEQYDQTQKTHSNKITHGINSPRGNTSMGSLSYLQPDMNTNASAHQSLNFGQACFNTTLNSNRNTSLTSTNKGLFGGSFDFDVMLDQFQGHRRTPSVYSDVSATSLQHSPNLAQQNFLDLQNSPIQIAQDPASYQDVLAIGNFSLSDPQIPTNQSNKSPSHSPAISPRLNQEQLNHENLLFNEVERFCNNKHFFPQEPFPSLQNEKGQALQMIPPEINVEFVSMSKQNSFETSKPNLFDRNALTPTDKGRRRALTDTSSNNSNLISRPRNTSCFSARYSPNLDSYSPDTLYSPSPNSDPRNKLSIRARRRSTSAMPNRDHTFNLTDFVFQPLASESTKVERAQKHPATYQCHLCPKKFTRAYNLRSHLRTHTNERPYICSKCTKAFARQHDRKRHESLHSGEKRFICRGELKNGGQWGCGRPFARADALNRHFRSEAGRNCINPLIAEDESEKLRLWNEKQVQNLQQTQSQSAMPGQIEVLPNRFELPAALLAQYPALAPFNWSDLPQGEGIIEENLSGRSSFDASGSEYYE